MKLPIAAPTLLWTLLAGGCAAPANAVNPPPAEPRRDHAYYSLENVPARLAGHIAAGRVFRFTLEENATTGYCWSLSGAPRGGRVAIGHRGNDSARCGAPGRAEIAVTPSAPGRCEFVLRYARAFEPDRPAYRTLSCEFDVWSPASAVPSGPGSR